MTIFGLLVAVIATIVVVWLVREGRIPEPFPWVLYVILVVLWLWVILTALGVNLYGLRVTG